MDRAARQKTCFNFARAGVCRFGDSCRYSHEIGTINQGHDQHGKNTRSRTSAGGTAMCGKIPNQQSTTKDALRRWRSSIPLNPLQAQPLGPRLATFFQTASELVETEHAVMQDVILALNTEGGFLRLKELLDQNFETMSHASSVHVVTTQLIPFFKLTTHTNVATSFILEDKVHSIFNYLYGRQGERGIKVFTMIIKYLSAPQQAGFLSIGNLEPIFAAFSSMVTLNNNSILSDELPRLAEQLFKVVERIDDATSMQLQRLIRAIEQRLGLRHTITDKESEARPSQRRAAFVLSQDLPGHLSKNGPRHDNDHANIEDISVLPTFDEIKATRPPYLPPRDSSQHHLAGVQGLLDRHFRLLREDTVGQLRDAIAEELVQNKKSRHSAARVNSYSSLVVEDLSFSRWKGLRLLIRIEQPQHLSRLSTNKRKDWWERTNRLKADALVCIIEDQDSVLFCTVSELSHASRVKSELGEHDTGKDKTMYSSPNHCYLQLQLVDQEITTLTTTLQLFGKSGATRRLVEFPGVLLPSFRPTLEALKTMSSRNDLPFGNLLTESHDDGEAMPINLQPPSYARMPGFAFELRDAMENKSSMRFDVSRPFDQAKFKSQSVLDEAQADALLGCLGKSVALVQGPPGTGKSYTGVNLIKVLLAAKDQAKLGPILCVCYTNHALDQLLEHLIHHGVKQIIRMGSRSKSEVLEKCNLQAVTQKMENTGPERHRRWEITRELAEDEKSIDDLLPVMSSLDKESTIKYHLQRYFVDHHRELYHENVEEVEGFTTVRNCRGNEIQEWLGGRCRRTPAYYQDRPLDVLKTAQLYSMTANERQTLHQFWRNDTRQVLQDELLAAIVSHNKGKVQVDGIRREQELRCLQQANIIGITTTGLARQLDLLRNLASKVLVCEEAGEALEAHILTALLPSLEHIILIGDHQQLPPHIQNYELSRACPRGEQYSLDISLFERLIKPIDATKALPYHTLETQRRMHPSISKLIRVTLYPRLKDSPYVEDYPAVAGMKRRLFWFDHRESEASVDVDRFSTTSHSNDFEVKMVVALVTHLVRQGTYAANDIAVLTPYLGQLHKIRKVLQNQFEITMNERDTEEMRRQGLEDDNLISETSSSGVNKTALLKALAVSTIDNFQGEEAKVVIISLVRSNPEHKCGFLRTENRINVLLSRAQHGMYIIGDAQTCSPVKMWSDVIAMLQHDGNFGTSLELECPRHPDIPILVSKPDDFIIFSPEGGCNKKCDKRLDCGHRDLSKCHSDAMHRAVKCLEPCPRPLKGCDHGCTRVCGEKCINKCQRVLDGIAAQLECGHVKTSLPCWQFQDLSTVECKTVVPRTIPDCGHKIQLKCCIDVDSAQFKCMAVCGTVLECGHICKKLCSQCNKRQDGSIISSDHGKCAQMCGRNFNSCSHYCRMECHGDIPCECRAPCDNACEHSKCPKQCSEPCAPCASTTCASGRCTHTQVPCSMPCAATCDWLPCSRRCEEVLTCGHQCPTVCGEPCPPPQFCQICASQEVKDNVVDYILMSAYRDVDLNEDPCIIPRCGHILTISSMDGQMAMSEHYEMNGNLIIEIKANSVPFSMDELKTCGTCRGSLRDVSRYGRIVRRALLDESTKKFIRWAGLETINLTQALYREQQKLVGSLETARKDVKEAKNDVRLDGLPANQAKTLVKEQPVRYKQLSKIRQDVSKHLARVQIAEQPYQKVWNLVQYAKRSRDDVGNLHVDTTILQTRETVQATSLLVQCGIIMLNDFCALMEKRKVNMDLTKNFATCENLIQLAEQANQPLHAVEGRLFYVRFCLTERSRVPLDSATENIDKARRYISEARDICRKYPGSTRRIADEIVKVESMLLNSTFYTQMYDNEWKDIMNAMAQEFRGTGHWYTCVNGHPFTIGECGMPMQQARCPQCGAPIGGQNHRVAEGVTRATDLEGRFGQMRL